MPFPPDDFLSNIFKQQRELANLTKPLANIGNQYTHLYDALNNLQIPAFPELSHLSHIEDILSNSGISQSFFTLQQQIENKLVSLTSLSSELHRLSHTDTFASILASQENLYRIQDQFPHYTDLIELPSARVESVLAAAEAASRLWDTQSLFNELTLSSVSEYQSFVDRQFRTIAHDNDEIAERRLEVTGLSGDLFEAVNASLEIGGALEQNTNFETGKDLPEISTKTNIYGHVNQHIGFVYKNNFTGEIEEDFHKSIPARIVLYGCAITEQIYKINCTSENCGNVPIFKPTAQTMRSCALIPSKIATNELEFNLIIDCLYFLLYEGSGAAKKLVAIVNDSFLQPLWKVKHLRLAARHDIDHGSQSSINKKRKNIRDTYVSLINQPLPIRQGDWQKAQLRIYVEIDLMLQGVIMAMMKNE